MVTFHEIHDWRRVWNYCNKHSDINRLFDDSLSGSRNSMKRKLQATVETKDCHSFEISVDNAHAGFFLLFPLKDDVFEVHLVLKESFRGKRGVQIGRAGTRYAFSLPYVAGLVSFIPICLPEVIHYAVATGWKSIGRLKMLWKKGGVEYPVIGVTAERGAV